MKITAVLDNLMSLKKLLFLNGNNNVLVNRSTRKKAKIISVLFSFLMIGCAHYYYIPKALNVPLFTEKTDFRLSLSSGISAVSSSTDIQAAYALTDHFAVTTNFMFSNGGYFYERNLAKMTYFDGAIGYYKPFSEYWVFEIYGGLGTSSQRHEYYSVDYKGKSDLSFTRSFLQPSLGVTFDPFDIAVSSCISNLNFNKIENSATLNSSYYNDLVKINQNKHSILFEPAFTVRAGWKSVKVQLQYIYSFNLTNPDLNFELSKISLGVYISLSKKYLSQIIDE